MRLNLEIRHLKLIKAVAEKGTVSRAAEALHLTQSALSHQLRDIEEKLGTALFLRLKKRMILTAAGERLLTTAEKVLLELEIAEEDARRLGSSDGGVLRLATDCYTCYHWLPPLLLKFRENFPNVSVQIDAQATRNAVKALQNGKIDLAITDAEVVESDLEISKLFEDELVAVVSPHHRFVGRKYLNAVDFAEEHLFTYAIENKHSTFIRDFLKPKEIEPKKHSRIELTEAIIEMVKADLGIAVLANWAVRPHLENGTLKAVRLTKNGLRRQWSVVTRKNEINHSNLLHLQAFAKILTE